MKNTLRIILCLLLVVSCSQDRKAAVLQEGVWDPQVRQALNALLARPGKNAYAVFDFDQTSIVHDISNALWVYQVEHLCYGAAPSHHFLDGIPTPEDRMPGTDVSFAEMGATLSAAYAELSARAKGGASLESIRASEGYLDFRARMVSLLEAIDAQYGTWVTYLWQPGLLAGYDENEAKSLIRSAIADQLGKDKLAVETWRSPDGRWGGEIQRGIWVSPEMKDLYKRLKAAGIDVYICSASLEMIVEELACDAKLGFGMPADRVYGLRFVPGEVVVAAFDADYKQPNREGKIDCIKAYMAPDHGGASPVLVAGDSNGDVPMLTAFPDLQHGLVIDVARSVESAIGQLAAQARAEGNKGTYLVQPSFEK